MPRNDYISMRIVIFQYSYKSLLTWVFGIFFFRKYFGKYGWNQVSYLCLTNKIRLNWKSRKCYGYLVSNFSCCFCIIHGRVMSPALLRNVVKKIVKSKLIFQYRLIIFRMSPLITLLSKKLTDFYKYKYSYVKCQFKFFNKVHTFKSWHMIGHRYLD